MTISLLDLPPDILLIIFKAISFSDLRNLMLTCKGLKQVITTDNVLWKQLSKEIFIVNPNNPAHLSWYNKCRISYNWVHGIFKKQTLKKHKVKYMPHISFYNQFLLLATGSELQCYPMKNQIPFCHKWQWKLNVPQVDRCDIRTNDISGFKFKDNYLTCGNRDGCLTVYRHDDLYIRPQLKCHIRDCHMKGAVEVTAVENITRNKELSTVISVSNDDTILKYWQINRFDNDSDFEENCSREVFIHDCVGVRCIAIHSDQTKLAIGCNGNNKAMFLDVESGELLNSKSSGKLIPNLVRDIQWHDDNIVSYVTHSGYLQCMDNRNFEIVYSVMDPFGATLYCLKTDGLNAVVAGSSEHSRCILFDNRQRRPTQVYFTEKQASPVYSLDFNSRILIAAVDVSLGLVNFNVKTGIIPKKDYINE